MGMRNERAKTGKTPDLVISGASLDAVRAALKVFGEIIDDVKDRCFRMLTDTGDSEMRPETLDLFAMATRRDKDDLYGKEMAATLNALQDAMNGDLDRIFRKALVMVLDGRTEKAIALIDAYTDDAKEFQRRSLVLEKQWNLKAPFRMPKRLQA